MSFFYSLTRTSPLAGFVAFTLAGASQTWGYTPEDPVVQEMVTRGCGYLESFDDGMHAYRVQSAYGAGERALVAYAHYKANHDRTVPVVQAGIEAAKGIANESVSTGQGHDNKVTYAVAVSVLLLAEVDSQAYEPELGRLSRMLMQLQIPAGGFTYPSVQQGDTSQTQYAMLALWTLDRHGFPVDYERVKAAAHWLLRVQDPSGGWPYMGTDPGIGQPLKKQTSRVTFSTTLAGGSSILIAGDTLRAWGDTVSEDEPDIEGLPDALKVYKEDLLQDRRKKISFPKEPIFKAIEMCNTYLRENPYNRKASFVDFFYYQLYTQERYESFIEIATGAEKDQSPPWYNAGVEELREYQDESGAWGIIDAGSYTPPPTDTAFAILFLIRSTQRSIFTLNTGTLAGGQGLPGDTTEIRVEGSQIKGKKVAQAVTDMLDILESDGADELEGKSLPEDMKLATDPDDRAAQLDRLERLVRGSQSWQARRVAARVLGASDELRVVPALIYALSDPDTVVRRYAREGLRFISRKFEGFGMPDDPTRVEIEQAQRDWRNWYRTLDPGYVFLNQG